MKLYPLDESTHLVPGSDLNPAVPDSFQAFLVEGASFTKTEEYPVIPEWMVYRGVPKRILPFQKALNSREDLSETLVCFYSPDAEFERVRRNPRKYVSFFKRTAGIIGFDFSVHEDMPLVKQKAQMNDNLSLTFFFGNNGVPVIPNVRCGVDELQDEFLSAIPKFSTIAIGTHGFFRGIKNNSEWFVFLNSLVDVLHPRRIIVYGSLRGKLFDKVRSCTDVICFPSWIEQDIARRKGNDI